MEQEQKQTQPQLQMIEITLEERRAATRPNIYKNKKKYNRKNKHKRNGSNNNMV